MPTQLKRSTDDVFLRARARRRLPPPPIRRLLREGAGLTQQNVADTLGVTSNAVTQWETGRRQPRSRFVLEYVNLLERCAAEAMRE